MFRNLFSALRYDLETRHNLGFSLFIMGKVVPFAMSDDLIIVNLIQLVCVCASRKINTCLYCFLEIVRMATPESRSVTNFSN